MDAVAFAQSLDEILKWYPREITYAQLNLLDSHDTARFLTIAGNEVSALKLAFLTMFTYPGAPTIYYGDEIGMEGRQDPDSRRPMVWDSARWNHDVLDTTKRYTALRNQHAALRRGSIKGLYAQGKTIAYARSLDGETMIVALNADRSPVTFDLPIQSGARLVPEWSGEPVQIINGVAHGIRLSSREGNVWRVE